MNTKPVYLPDDAAIFGAATSLYLALQKRADENGNNLSDAYGGGDEFQRQCMRVARAFELYACQHVDFNNWPGGVWSYDLEDSFGDAYLDELSETELEVAETKFPEILAGLKLIVS